jgi:hypothetical protein
MHNITALWLDNLSTASCKKQCQPAMTQGDGSSKGRIPAGLSRPPAPGGVAGWMLADVHYGELAKSPELL